MKCRCLLKHTETVEEEKKKTEEKRRAQLKERRERGPETPLGTAFRCRGRPTAEYCRRLVVMETGRQSRLFMELCKNEHPPAPSSPPSLPHSLSSAPPFLLDGHRARTGSRTVSRRSASCRRTEKQDEEVQVDQRSVCPLPRHCCSHLAKRCFEVVMRCHQTF